MPCIGVTCCSSTLSNPSTAISPPEVESEGLLLEDEVYQRQLQLGGSDVSIQNLGKPAPFLFHLDEGQLGELGGILKQIKHTIDYTYI